MNVSFTAPAKVGDVLMAEEVTNQDGRLVASCQALVYRMGKPLPWLDG